ncbi:hypothetical protein GCM10010495_71420 [Kitasatospora herbaricolor]|nr:hypothetical protein GCM10010495_71420 [Kitasatospora herbaricolor]
MGGRAVRRAGAIRTTPDCFCTLPTPEPYRPFGYELAKKEPHGVVITHILKDQCIQQAVRSAPGAAGPRPAGQHGVTQGA